MSRGRGSSCMNLAGKGARDEWEELEEKWESCRSTIEAIENEADDVGDGALAATSIPWP